MCPQQTVPDCLNDSAVNTFALLMSHLLKNVCEKVTQTSTGNLLIIHLIYLCFSTIIPDQGEKGLALLPVYISPPRRANIRNISIT